MHEENLDLKIRNINAEIEKTRYLSITGFILYLGWLLGLEPTTTGITILDSTN